MNVPINRWVVGGLIALGLYLSGDVTSAIRTLVGVIGSAYGAAY